MSELKEIGVIGAGAMGRGIAQVCAAAGCRVHLLDTNPEAVSRALQSVKGDLDQAVSKGKLTREEADATLRRIQPAHEIAELADSGLVVEAIIERLEAKQALLRQVEEVVGADCILATNTSSLSVTAIAAGCSLPGRVAGWHFFNPVPRMRVVEVVQGLRTNGGAAQALMALSERIGHRPILTIDTPGFVVNHAGRAFVTEGLKMLSENVASHVEIDAILRQCAGFRMGPLELLDLTGLDVSVPVMESIHAQFYRDDRYRPAALARTRLQAGLLGRKSGEGFYTYEGGASQRQEAVDRPVTAGGRGEMTAWWPTEGPGAVPPSVGSLLSKRSPDPGRADVILMSPIGADLTSTVSAIALDAKRVIGVDPVFASREGVTLMASPATSSACVEDARQIFAAQGIRSFVIADSPGYVAPRVVACIVNLACEMAQQGIASPADIDVAVRLGLGYPNGPFQWGDQLGARTVLEVLQGLQRTFGDQRYRPSPWLVRRAQLGLPLSAPDRQV